MKFMLISYATKDWEAGLPPDPRLLAAVAGLSKEAPKIGKLVSTGGLSPSSMGAKVRVSGGKVLVTDGPFAETKEIVGGYAMVDVASKEEAIAVARRFWQVHVDVFGPSFEGGGEIRQLFHEEQCNPQNEHGSSNTSRGRSSKEATKIVEYIRYSIAEADREAFEAAYSQAQAALTRSSHCLAYELSQCAEDGGAYILRIEWDSAEGHLQGFRTSPEFREFVANVRPFVGANAEMRHYEVTAVSLKK